MHSDYPKSPSPPRWPQRFLEWFCPSHLYETVSGDLLEKFEEEVASLGIKKAKVNFILNVLRFVRPGIVLRNEFSYNPFNTVMWRSHFTSAGRNVWKHKTNSVVNILGLAMGVVCTLIIAMIIRYEMSFDTFHTAAADIYRIVRISQVEGQMEYRTGVVSPLPTTLSEEIPGLKNITSVSYHRNAQFTIVDVDKTSRSFQENEGCGFVDSTFFDVFDFNQTQFKWLVGNRETAFSQPNTIVLTRSIAEKYFQSIDVLGKVLTFEKMLDLQVTGVVEDLPKNTDLPLKVMISYATIQQLRGERFMTEWSSVSDVNQCYFILPPGVGKVEIERQIAKIHAAHVPKDLAEMRSYKLQPLNEVHSDPRFGNYNLRTVTPESIWALAIIGGFLLIMVCINFINLSTAHAITRSKSVGIRKVLGSTRMQVMGQSIVETLLIITIATSIAIVISALLLNQIQSLTRTHITSAIYSDPFVWIFLALLAATITLLAGLYPAVSLSRYKPILAIKNSFNSKVWEGLTLREILLVTQFTIMQVLIIATFIAVKQMQVFKHMDMGFNKEAVINVEVPETSSDKLEAFENDMLSHSNIRNVSFSSSLPSGLKRAKWVWEIKRKSTISDEMLIFEYQSVDHNYLDLYDIKLLAGKGFAQNNNQHKIIINQTLSSKLGFSTPEQAIDNEVIIRNESITIIGVIEDIYSNSFKNELDKVGLMVVSDQYRLASIKLNSLTEASSDYQGIEASLAYIEQKWNSHFDKSVFTYSFLDDNVQAFYEEEARITNLFRIFSFVFLIIGCLGLYGLVSFIVNKKTKEVAVRKVLGASISQILLLFSKDYIKQIALAFIIAVPITYYFMSGWLNGFAYQITLHWWYFVAPGVFVLSAALLSVGSTTWRSAIANPTDSLRSE